jgi:hypothetical protein
MLFEPLVKALFSFGKLSFTTLSAAKIMRRFALAQYPNIHALSHAR